MNSEHQALTDVPLWLLVLLSLAGLSGEMLRASGSDLGLRQILQRVALRFLASGLLGKVLAKRLAKETGFSSAEILAMPFNVMVWWLTD
jgi:hypothetical protein